MSITQSAASFPYKSSSQCKDVRSRAAAAALPTSSSPEGGQTRSVVVLRNRASAVEVYMTRTVLKAVVKTNANPQKTGQSKSKEQDEFISLGPPS